MKYILWFDGASRGNPGSAGAGCLIEGFEFKQEIRLGLGKTTNNFAEYNAILLGLEFISQNMVQFKKMKELLIKGDSQLVIKQLQGKWKVKSKNLQELHIRSRSIIKKLQKLNVSVKLEYIPRKQNQVADRLANEGADLN